MDMINKDSWTEQDILDIIAAKTEESIHLDFKAAAALSKKDGNQTPKAEITKDVSAFANSDGGIIIYGVREKDHVADSVDYVDGDEFTKEWLEQLISGGVQRTIMGLRIFPIRFGGDIKHTVYVVSIPASPSAPHMNGDKRYYRRYEFQSVKMEEYEVRNLYNRRSTGTVTFSGCNVISSQVDGSFFKCKIDFEIGNRSNSVAEQYKLAVYIPLAPGVYVDVDTSEYTCLHDEDKGKLVSIKNVIPIYPGEVVPIMTLLFRVFKTHVNYLLTKEFDRCAANVLSVLGHQNSSIELGRLLYNAYSKAINPQASS